jgi:hypothetical protein
MPEQIRYRTKLTQSSIFLVQYRTKIWDAGMPMSALVSSMPMPSYANRGSDGRDEGGVSCLVLVIWFWLSFSVFPFLVSIFFSSFSVRHGLSSSNCNILAVFFWLSVNGSPILAVRSCCTGSASEFCLKVHSSEN